MNSTPHPLSAIRRRRMTPIAVMGGVILGLILVVMLIISFQTGSRIRQIKIGWQEYSQDANPRGIWISEIRGYFGYGGMIHNFKNYVLRKDEQYHQALQKQRSFLLQAIANYQNAEPDAVEVDVLRRIE